MRQIISFSALIGLTIGLSGCAELSSLKHSVFKKEDSAGKTFHNADDRSLRDTPSQTFVFDGSKEYDVTLYDISMIGSQTTRGNVHYYYSDHYYEMERSLSNLSYESTDTYMVEIFDTMSTQNTFDNYTPSSTGAGSAYSGPNISFVNNAGETNMADWMACEAKVGRYIVWQTTRFEVDPEFEHCMQAKGYTLENDIA